jgi:hypothetical protein
MSTSYSDRLRLALQGTGDNPNTWGAITNQAVIELLEDSVAGVEELIVGSTNITLTTANGSTDQARKAVLKLTGVISADVNLIVPNEQKTYLIDAQFTGSNTLTVKPTSGSGVSFTSGQRGVVYCDSTNVILITKDFDSSTLGDLAFLDTITSTGLLANGIVTTSTMATGAVTASILAPGVISSLLPVQTSNAGKSLTTDGTNLSWQSVSQTFLNVVNYYPSGGTGPGFTTGSWVVFPMSTLVSNSITGASYSANQVVLPAGTYKADILGMNYGAGKTQVRLRNVTDSTTTILGTTAHGLEVGTGSYLATIGLISTGEGVFTITGNKTFELQIFTTQSNGAQGIASGENNVAASMVFAKVG